MMRCLFQHPLRLQKELGAELSGTFVKTQAVFLEGVQVFVGLSAPHANSI